MHLLHAKWFISFSAFRYESGARHNIAKKYTHIFACVSWYRIDSLSSTSRPLHSQNSSTRRYHVISSIRYVPPNQNHHHQQHHPANTIATVLILIRIKHMKTKSAVSPFLYLHRILYSMCSLCG